MGCCNAYESKSMAEVTGETLRPGGFRLTEKAVQLCGLSPWDAVLDLGCGRGATVNYLCNTHRIRTIGIDPSEKLIEDARKRYGFADFLTGRGEDLPFESECFTCVFAECTLSLMENLNRVLKETFRVLKGGGRLVVTDVYARNAREVSGLRPFAMFISIFNEEYPLPKSSISTAKPAAFNCFVMEGLLLTIGLLLLCGLRSFFRSDCVLHTGRSADSA